MGPSMGECVSMYLGKPKGPPTWDPVIDTGMQAHCPMGVSLLFSVIYFLEYR